MKPTTAQPEPAIDVVVVSHNSGAVLQDCLAALLQPAAAAIRICLVDNASTDDSRALIPNDERITVINNTQNLGFATACNQGAQTGQAPTVAFINPDCFIQAQQLQQLSTTLDATPGAVLVGCQVLNQDGSLQPASRRRLPTLWRVLCHITGLSRLPGFRGINIRETAPPQQAQPVEAVNGACFVVQRAAFEAIGGFDEGFPLHFEDLDLFVRLQQNQGQLWYEPAVAVTHLQGHSEQRSAVIKAWKKQGLRRYFRKHRPRWEHALIKVLSHPA
ncbi:glycosyltransferase family 2 protein [Marinicella meishanensis]|uniref:glycosyltransferase family 2 protein n=1 Tax=Marinicella meishanensis TaxID=2873263 RepID=UPI001CBB6AF8|nr:glycosyltransferase family 2 protein [Marinicella sp. NBU2979]